MRLLPPPCLDEAVVTSSPALARSPVSDLRVGAAVAPSSRVGPCRELLDLSATGHQVVVSRGRQVAVEDGKDDDVFVATGVQR